MKVSQLLSRASVACVVSAGLMACGSDSAHSSRAAGATARSSAGGGSTAESNGDVVIRGTGSAYKVVTVRSPGTVSGTVTVKATPAPVPPVPSGAAGAVCGASIADESIQLAGNHLAGAVVWLDGIHEGKAPPDDRRLELESVQCRLRPRVQAALTGSAVNIIGHDQFMQHLRFTAGGDTAARATVLVGGGEQVIPTELPFKSPGLVMVRDPDHPWTRAWLAVFDHPYFAVTGADGAYSITGVPPGSYTLHVWHERTGDSEQHVSVPANGVVKSDVVVSVR